MTKKIFTVLCIDGGGVRGVIPARILHEIEKRTGKPISELFDLVAGTSTGSILAAGLTAPDPTDATKPKMSAKDMLSLYFDRSSDIFPPIRYRQMRHMMPGVNGFYDADNFEKILEHYMGDTRVKDTLTHIMIPATEIKRFEPVWISHFKGHEDKDHWGSMLLSDAVRASSSAPTIFPARYVHTHPNENAPDAKERYAFIDGTFFAGTMARRVYTAAQKLAPKDAKIVVVHIGTGFMASNYTPEEFNKMTPLDLVTTKEDGPSILNMSLNMFSMDIHKDLHEELGCDFFEFDAQINDKDPESPKDSIDDASPENLKRLDDFALNKVIKQNQADFDRLCQFLNDMPEMNRVHEESLHALQQLHAYLENSRNIKQLGKRYKKIIEYSCEIPSDETKALLKGEDALCSLSQQLLEEHLVQLDHTYRMLVADVHLKKHAQPGLLRRMANKVFRRNPKQDGNTPKAGNDNTPKNTANNDNAVTDKPQNNDKKKNTPPPSP